ncbi:hypothetical protein KIL84_004122, partial [Mauremys mutica]
ETSTEARRQAGPPRSLQERSRGAAPAAGLSPGISQPQRREERGHGDRSGGKLQMEERLNGNENTEGGGENSLQQLTEPLNCNGHPDRGDEPGYSCNRKFQTLVAGVFIVLIIIIIVLAVSVGKSSNPPSAGPDPPAAAGCCPDGWVGYGGKCYYFSEAEGDWNNSQSNCSSFGASLAGIDTPQEMAFIKRHKDLSEHWIGLRREPGQVWKWTNGTEFNHWFEVRAQGECAYLNDEAVTSSWCDTVRYWICSKPAGLTLRKENGAQGQAEMSELS